MTKFTKNCFQTKIKHCKKSLKILKGVIRIRKSKDRQHNDQKKMYKQRFTKHSHKTKD